MRLIVQMLNLLIGIVNSVRDNRLKMLDHSTHVSEAFEGGDDAEQVSIHAVLVLCSPSQPTGLEDRSCASVESRVLASSSSYKPWSGDTVVDSGGLSNCVRSLIASAWFHRILVLAANWLADYNLSHEKSSPVLV